MKNDDIQCTGFVNVFASFSRRFDHGRLILSPLVVVEPGLNLLLVPHHPDLGLGGKRFGSEGDRKHVQPHDVR